MPIKHANNRGVVRGEGGVGAENEDGWGADGHVADWTGLGE